MDAIVVERCQSKALSGSQETATDEQLLDQYRDFGDRAAFAALVRRYERELYTYLRRYLGNALAAEDVFQQTFMLVHQKVGQYESGRPVRPWLYSIAVHQAIDYHRRDRRHWLPSLDRFVGTSKDEMTPIVAGQNDPAETVEADDTGRLVREAIDKLPETTRQIVMLVYFQGLKYREVSEILGIPMGTVKSQLHAALMKLNRLLQIAGVSE